MKRKAAWVRDMLTVTAQPTPWKKGALISMTYETHEICRP